MKKWGGASVNTALATLVNGKDILEFISETGEFFLNGQHYPVPVGNRIAFDKGGNIHRTSPTHFTVTAPNGIHFLVIAYHNPTGAGWPDHRKGFFNIEVVAPENIPLSKGFCVHNIEPATGLSTLR